MPDIYDRKFEEWDRKSRKGFVSYILRKGAHKIAEELKEDPECGKLCDFITQSVLNGKEDFTFEVKGPNDDVIAILLDATSEACECQSLRNTYLDLILREKIVRRLFWFLAPK